MKNSRIDTVKEFIAAYNSMNLEEMFKYFHPEIEFKNISNGEINTNTKGIDEFKELAKKSLEIFRTREQRIISYIESGDTIKVEIMYHAILAIDLQNGLKPGDKLEMKGRSTYTFKDDLITMLIDES
jgi:hypothetical protein